MYELKGTCSQPSAIFLATAKPRLIHWITRRRGMICHVSIASVQLLCALHHSFQHLAVAPDDIRLVFSCSALEARSTKLSAHCSWATLTTAWSPEGCSCRLQKVAYLCVQCTSSSADPAVIVRGLPLCGWDAVSNHFHFNIMPQLTEECVVGKTVHDWSRGGSHVG